MGYKIKEGYAIFLANDLGYLKGFKVNSLCYNYGLENNKIFISDSRIKFLVSNQKDKKDTCVSHLEEITFKNTYKMEWNNYSEYLKVLILRII